MWFTPTILIGKDACIAVVLINLIIFVSEIFRTLVRMTDDKIARIDLDQIIKDRLPGRKIPTPVMKYLKKIVHQDDLNELFASAPGKKNIDFIDVCMDYFQISCDVVGMENLPPKGTHPLIFASNHPLGALEAISIGYVLGHQYDGKIKFYANEFLTLLDPLKELFLPIQKYGAQGREGVQVVQDFFNSDNHLITFPAGATSRKYGNEIIDLEWHKNFIKKAVENKRDVVPLYFKARNSKFFYRLEKFREFTRSKVNFEMIYLVDEVFKQKGNTFTLYIGNPIPWQTFDKSKSQKEWAAWVKEIVYNLPEKSKNGN